MREHAPAPWRLAGPEGHRVFGPVPAPERGQNYVRIASVERGQAGTYYTPAMSEANARLIRAAPQLLDALRDIRDEIGDSHSDITPPLWQKLLGAADAAIEDATGEDGQS